ncbi:hypothetical protein Gotur_012683 [Gossypium turneri]
MLHHTRYKDYTESAQIHKISTCPSNNKHFGRHHSH